MLRLSSLQRDLATELLSEGLKKSYIDSFQHACRSALAFDSAVGRPALQVRISYIVVDTCNSARPWRVLRLFNAWQSRLQQPLQLEAFVL